jgi:hypothetical protein
MAEDSLAEHKGRNDVTSRHTMALPREKVQIMLHPLSSLINSIKLNEPLTSLQAESYLLLSPGC